MKTYGKPRVHLRCPANVSSPDNERIIEFSNGGKTQGVNRGGLFSIRRDHNDATVAELYRLDPDVIVRAPPSQVEGMRELVEAVAYLLPRTHRHLADAAKLDEISQMLARSGYQPPPKGHAGPFVEPGK